jgi:hypothetical protein
MVLDVYFSRTDPGSEMVGLRFGITYLYSLDQNVFSPCGGVG